MKVALLTKERLEDLFAYKNGSLISITNRTNCPKGSFIGTKGAHGYLTAHVDCVTHRVHRLIFMLVNGYMPKTIDHIDGDKLNNKIENLRPCTRYQNQQNIKISKRNKTGTKGVYFCSKSNKYLVRISANGKRHFIGSFITLSESVEAATVARKELHGVFYCNDRRAA